MAVGGLRCSRLVGASALLLASILLAGCTPPGAATWTVDTSAGATLSGGLTSVSCPTPSTCVTIGFGNSPAESTGTWNQAPLAPFMPSTASVSMEGISCPDGSFCMAVGTATPFPQTFGNPPPQSAPIERWDGSTWTVVPSPTPSGQGTVDALQAVSCVSEADCVAVGEVGTVFPLSGLSLLFFSNVLVETWDGKSWSVVPGLTGKEALNGVSCAGTTACIAVGGYTVPEALAFDGTSWSAMPVATPTNSTTSSSGLSAVSCPLPSYCTAAGHETFTGGGYSIGTFTLTENWNGATWSVVPSPDAVGAGSPGVGTPQLGGGSLTSVSCTAALTCVATGSLPAGGADAGGAGYPARTVIETWDGTDWSMTPTPPIAGADTTTSSLLNSVSCGLAPTGTACTAVGVSGNTTSTSLIEETSSAIGGLDPTVPTVTVSPAGATAGVPVTVQVSVAPTTGTGNPTGSVTFLDNGQAIAGCPPVALSGTGSGPLSATCTTTAATGDHFSAVSTPATPPTTAPQQSRPAPADSAGVPTGSETGSSSHRRSPSPPGQSKVSQGL